jgi:hypothetical protein
MPLQYCNRYHVLVYTYGIIRRSACRRLMCTWDRETAAGSIYRNATMAVLYDRSQTSNPSPSPPQPTAILYFLGRSSLFWPVPYAPVSNSHPSDFCSRNRKNERFSYNGCRWFLFLSSARSIAR